MWRLRALEESYFEQFYTNLIRHVTQGRLLRGSTRGVLLTGQDRYMLGNSVEVRAQLMNSRLEPLAAPSVEMQVFVPNGPVRNVTLRPDPSRIGTYQGQFPATEEGAYRLELTVPESDNERLIRRIQVRMPELERENPQRNDALLGQIAKESGGNSAGKYYIGVDAIFRDKPTLAEQLPRPHQHDHPNRHARPQLGRNLAALDDACIVRAALRGMVDKEIGKVGLKQL